MANGHSWSSIQHYSLSEIGSFLRVIVKSDRQTKAENLSSMWLAHNADQKTLNELIADMGSSKGRSKEQDQEKVMNEWNRLASFMKGRI